MPTRDDERMIFAAKNGDLGKIQDLFRQYPPQHFLTTKRYKHSVTPLHAACLKGTKPHVVEFLLRKGMDPNASDAWHCTPLHNVAAGSGRLDIIELLLKYGARSDIESGAKGKNPIELARSMEHYDAVQFMMEWKQEDQNHVHFTNSNPTVDTAAYVHEQGSRNNESAVDDNLEESPSSKARREKREALKRQLEILEYEEKMNNLKKMELQQGQIKTRIESEYGNEIQSMEERISRLKSQMNDEMEKIERNFSVIHHRMRELSMTSAGAEE